ncbi:UL36 very large tegument protein [Streptomyces pacificus]|uniref:UL36 very large tegument protein n=1 Tax=Streptomyces pacificus TaxID=2705029 RepID=A0A6A0B2Y6_9ACTN|nr:UL36 very large tegument protein [Streptomyces pacificus]GFH39502.1 hypothetical protein SCWH03_57700 [Streptomyces pacificus]
MTAQQLPYQVWDFVRYLNAMTARLDPEGGWYAVFRSRDPEGLAACLRGAEIAPWDVVESLLEDLAADGAETAHARRLHAAAATAHDRRPGGAEALRQRLEVMRREQARAAERGRVLLRRLAAVPGHSAAYRDLARDLSWADDDHTRATSRCAELAARTAALGTCGAGGAGAWGATGTRESEEPRSSGTGRPAEGSPGSGTPGGRLSAGRTPPSARQGPGREARRGGGRRPRGARYAWFDGGAADGGAEPVPVPGAPELPVAAPPRGARFGGGAGAEPGGATGRPAVSPVDEGDRRAALATVARLGRLRAEGRGGEAHAVLCEAASGPPARLPVLAAELHRAGLDADWATLLWEVATLPPERLAEAACALAEAGREDDCGRLLRQGAARPAGEIADAALALTEAGGRPEADALLVAFLRVRAPEEGARMAAADPRRLVPRLLSAARAVSPGHERDLVHALRVAGLIGA